MKLGDSLPGNWSWLYFAVFPLDLFFPTPNSLDFQEQKTCELFPVFVWLLPLIVVLTNTVSLGLMGTFFLFAFLAIALSFLSAVHLQLEVGPFVELALNLLASLIGLSLFLFLAAFFLGLFVESEG